MSARIKPVLADKYTQTIGTTDFLCVNVSDPTQLSLLISQFNQLLPLPPNLSHLKRIKSSNENKCYSLLLASPSLLPTDLSLSEALEHLPSLPAKLTESLGEVSIVEVPMCRPLTSLQCKEVKEIWPSVSSHYPQIERQLSRQPFSSKELSEMESYMRVALNIAADPSPTESPPIASVIIDPRTKKILAEFRHSSGSLDHSVMLCIREIAKSQVYTPVEPGVKRKVTTHDQYNSNGSYLCTGLELYTTQEPCVMCSMALVHARISRVVYGMDNKEMGGLGSVYKIHCQEGINHHFQVYRGLLKDECEQLWP